jgi:hypothetical protein
MTDCADDVVVVLLERAVFLVKAENSGLAEGWDANQRDACAPDGFQVRLRGGQACPDVPHFTLIDAHSWQPTMVLCGLP